MALSVDGCTAMYRHIPLACTYVSKIHWTLVLVIQVHRFVVKFLDLTLIHNPSVLICAFSQFCFNHVSFVFCLVYQAI